MLEKKILSNVEPHSQQGVPLYTAQQVKAMDELAVAACVEGEYPLMEQAGEAVFMAILSQWPSVRQLLVLCGKGNNGGDGFVVARLAMQHEIEVQLVLCGSVDELSGDAALAAKDTLAAGVSVIAAQDIVWPTQFDGAVIVDALLGTGLSSDVQGELAQIITQVNESGLPVIAIDVPSGINATTGALQGVAIQAKTTLCMIAYKQGLFTGLGPAYAGQVRLAPLSVSANIRDSQISQCHLLNWQFAQKSPLFTKRSLDAHKGHFGHVLIIGGDLGCGGAVSLAAGAALRSGTGLVSVATRPEHVAAVLARYPEAMVHGVNSGQECQPLLERADVIVIGPGLGQNAWGQQLLQQVMAVQTPILLDADALNLLAAKRIKHNLAGRISVITPHPGEAARLSDSTVEAIQNDRFTYAQQLAEQYSSVVVLKGLGSLICEKQQMHICSDGNPGMASAGMGDVLSGLLGSLMAQHGHQLATQLLNVVSHGVCLHSASADQASKQGQAGLLASDVVSALQGLLK